MKIEFNLFRGVTTFTMPVAGTITRLPKRGDCSIFTVDSIHFPDQYLATHRIQKGESVTDVLFTTNTFQEEYQQLIRDKEEREGFLKEFRQQFGDKLSSQPVEDPYLVTRNRDTNRINNAYS